MFNKERKIKAITVDGTQNSTVICPKPIIDNYRCIVVARGVVFFGNDKKEVMNSAVKYVDSLVEPDNET